jgi:hypothetical protein
MKVLFSLFLLMLYTPVHAGDAENISACAAKAKEFTGTELDPFSAKYQGKVLTFSTVKWSNAYCEVKLASVFTLQINGKDIIYKGYAGKESYELNNSLQAKTDSAIAQMNSRISLLKQRAEKASDSLRKPSPDFDGVTKFVNEGLEKSIGSNQ